MLTTLEDDQGIAKNTCLQSDSTTNISKAVFLLFLYQRLFSGFTTIEHGVSVYFFKPFPTLLLARQRSSWVGGRNRNWDSMETSIELEDNQAYWH